MKGFLEGIETTDFRKPFKRLIIIALVVVIACGTALGLVCPECGKMRKAADKFCPDCGRALTNKSTKEVQL